MSGPELQAMVERLRQQKQQASMQRNTMQIENDLINDFYKNTREEIKELNAQVKNYDAVMQREEETANSRVL